MGKGLVAALLFGEAWWLIASSFDEPLVIFFSIFFFALNTITLHAEGLANPKCLPPSTPRHLQHLYNFSADFPTTSENFQGLKSLLTLRCSRQNPI